MDFQDPAHRFFLIAGIGIVVLVFLIIRSGGGQGSIAKNMPTAKAGPQPETAKSSNASTPPPPKKDLPQGGQKKPYNKGGNQGGGQPPYNKNKPGGQNKGGQGSGGKKPHNKGGNQGGKNFNKKKY